MLRPPAVHPLVAALLRSFVCFALRRERARFLAGDGARFILVFLPIPSRQKRCWRVAASWGRGAARAHTTRERDQLPGFGWVLAQQEQRGQRELFFWRSKSNLKRAFRFGSACTSRSDRASSRSRSRPGGGLAGRETPHRQGCSQQAHRTPPACAESSDIAHVRSHRAATLAAHRRRPASFAFLGIWHTVRPSTCRRRAALGALDFWSASWQPHTQGLGAKKRTQRAAIGLRAREP